MKKIFTPFIRHIAQIISFVAIPGLFIVTLNSVGSIYLSVIHGTFSWSSQLSSIITLLAVMPVTIIGGRFFCGYLCAFGSMTELISFISGKLKIKQIKISRRADKYLKNIKYIILAIIFVAWTAGISLTPADPWYVFGIYSSIKGWSDLSMFLSIGGAFLILIIIGSFFIERFFCRYLCPLGGIFSFISVFRMFKIKKTNETCVKCNLCSKKCPMSIDVNKEGELHGKVVSSECIDCFRCISVCPTKALDNNSLGTISAPIAAVAVSGVYFAGNILSSTYADTGAPETENISAGNSSQSDTSQYKDGTYYGSGVGFRGKTKVNVTVENGKINSITIESFMDDEEFFNRAKNTVINSIISKQSTDVSAVSGATFSSEGIINAVKDALSSAEVNDNESETSDNTSSDDGVTANTPEETYNGSQSGTSSAGNDTPKTNDDTASGNFKDGTYTGTGYGRNGSIEVEVTVSDGSISSIEIISSYEDAPYLSRATSVINSVINSQSVDVATVSGATMSSNGILEAVANALGLTYNNTNDDIHDNHSHRRFAL